MYQFTTTNVINSQYALDYNGNILKDGKGNSVAKYAGTSTAFTVAKVGTFKSSGIVSVYKRPYSAGVLETATLTIAAPATSGDQLRLTIEIRQSQNTQSEYTNYSLDFKKPIVVEIISSGNSTTDAAALVAQLNTLRDRFGYGYVTATSSTNVITLVAKENTQRFNVIDYAKITPNANSLVQYDAVTVYSGVITVPGALGFGDDAWMQRSIMLQTLENTRYFGISKDERPVLGGNYTEYALRYSIPKDGNDGTWGAGTSVTTHVFYVISTQQAAFETALQTTFPGIITIGGDQDIVIIGDEAISATTTGGSYLVRNVAPSAGFSALVYSDAGLTTASSAVATVTATGASASSGATPTVGGTTGVTTFDVQKVGPGTVYVKVYETGNTAKFASIKIVIT